MLSSPITRKSPSNKTSLNSRDFKNYGPMELIPPTIRSIRFHKRFTNLTSSFLSTHNHYIFQLIIIVSCFIYEYLIRFNVLLLLLN